ncbi:MAG: DNA-binding domain-containing protein [Casimicrobiaceae bacterium]
MPSLLELQRGFSAATLFGDTAAVASLPIVAGALDSNARIGIYRNNVLGNYRKVLAATFPVVCRLVGGAFFDAAAEQFVRGHSSTRGDVNRYGGDFAVFLAAYLPARELVYLAGVARLEWAIDQANIAADAAPLEVAALASVAPDALANLRFQLHPAARLIASPFPILRIWQVNQADRGGDETVDLAEGRDTLLVTRSAQGVAIDRIGRGDHAFLTALAANATLAVAAERAGAADPEFDLVGVLRRHVANHTIVAFRAPVTTHRKGGR